MTKDEFDAGFKAKQITVRCTKAEEQICVPYLDNIVGAKAYQSGDASVYPYLISYDHYIVRWTGNGPNPNGRHMSIMKLTFDEWQAIVSEPEEMSDISLRDAPL